MLILQRKEQQTVTIGDNIRVTILDIGNDWVKLAIDAPKDMPILRTELIEAASANQEAVSNPMSAESLSRITQLLSKYNNSENT